MKIVIVLCSLATFAIAVPVYQENVFESTLGNQASNIKRERKSALHEITPGLFAKHGIEIPIRSSKKSGQGTSLEAKSFRRPIIIKRKLGYHVYRDSDEEMAYAEPGEKCREQVKFKLCDHEPVSSSKNDFKSPTFKCLNSHSTDNEMGNSIKMAKEAVEHLQKDLKRMEKFSPKMVNPNIEDIESNTGLHHDIEIAREALDHIEQNFESVNLEVNKVKDLQIPKSQDEEKLTRWREAIENIHKNFAIAKNIEDAFKSDNHLSLLRSDSIKAVESEEPEHSEGQVFVQHKFTNDNLENNDEVYNEDKILKSASNEDVIVQRTPKTEDVSNIGKDAGNDMYVFPTENREEKILHSDSLKSEINFKDTSLRSDVSEIESTKHETNVPKESIEYALRNSNSLPESNPESKSENSPLERPGFIPKSTTIESSKNSEASEEEIKYSDKYNHKEVENKSKSYNTNMRLSNDQLEKTEQRSANSFKYTDEYKNTKSSEIQDGQIGSRMSQNQESNKLTFLNDDSLKTVDQKEPQLYKTVSATAKEHILNDRNKFANEYGTEEEMGMIITQNKDANDDPKWKFSKYDPELYSDQMLSIHREIEDKSDDQHSYKSQASMRLSQTQTGNLQSNEYHDGAEQASSRFENSSDDPKTPLLKSIPELQPYPKASLPTDKEDVTNDQQSHREEASMRASENLYEKMPSNEYQEVHEPLPIGLDIERHPEENTWKFPKSVPELPFDLMVSIPKEKADINDNQHAHKEEVSMRSSENQNDKKLLNENQEVQEPLTMGLDLERHPEERTWHYSVPELSFDPMSSTPTEKVDITDDQHAYKGEESMRSSENQNDKMILNNNQEGREPLPIGLDIERYPEERTWQLFKSVTDLPIDPMASRPIEKVDVTDDQHVHKGEESLRTSENQYDKMQSNQNQEMREPLSMGLDIERHSEERSEQYSKSVPELQLYPKASLPLDITNDRQSHNGEASMRSADNTNEENKFEEIQEVPLSVGIDIERHPEERTWQLSKSVHELPYDPMVSIPGEKVDITDDQHFYDRQASMRMSFNPNEKLQLTDYQEELEHSLTSLDSDKVETTNNLHLKGEEASMKSADGQNDKKLSNENLEVHQSLPLGLDTERHPEERTWQYSEDVPEMPYNSMVSMPMENVDITEDQHAHKGEASMRSSESQSEKLQLNKNKEDSEQATILNIENNSDNSESQFFKSVPELQLYPIASLSSDKVDITNDQQSYIEEASVRSSERQNDKIQSNEYKEVHESLPMGSDLERHPDDRTWQYSKSVPELPNDPMVSMATEKIDITDHEHAPKEEESMRSSENQNDKMQLNVYQDKPEHTSTTLNIENNSDDTNSQFLKSASELQPMPTDKVGITNDKQSLREEATMRSSESQNEKMQSNENQEVHEPLPMILDIERHSKERTWQDSKSVPELSYDKIVSRPTEQVDITDHQHVPKEEESMRSSKKQNDKIQLNEYQDKPEHASTTLNIENNSDDTKTELLKSASELQPMPTDKVDITNDKQSHREGATMRSSESQNEKMQSNDNQQVHESLPMVLDIERHREERTWQDSKSVPELSYDPIVSRPTEQVDITDDPHVPKGEESMRSAENQNDKMQSNVYQKVHVSLPLRSDFERHPDERTWQYSKSVPELPHDPMVSMATEKIDITDHEHAPKEEESMRSSENQNDKMQLNVYQDKPEHSSTTLNIENNSDDTKTQFMKSASELQLMPTDKVDITNDQHPHREQATMRSSEGQTENQEVHEPLPMVLDIERHSEERTWQDSKSVPELSYDSIVPKPTEQVDITDEHSAHKGEVSMKTAEYQNDKVQSNANQELLTLPTELDIERHPEERNLQYSKSVPELSYDAMVSMPTEKVDITDDQHANKGEEIMRSSENQNDKMQSNENQEVYEPLSTGLDIERLPEERSWKYSKSVPELQLYPIASLPVDNVDITNDQQSHNGETIMRTSENQNVKMQSNKNQEVREPLSSGLDIERHPEERMEQYSKSVLELPYDSIVSGKVDNINDQYYKGDASMRVSETQNEKFQLNEIKETHEPLIMRLDMTNQPEEQKWQLSKSVPELPYDPMVSMPTDKVEIIDEQHSLNEGNFRFSQNQNERTQFQESHGLQDFFPTKLGIENHPDYPEHSAPQFLKSEPELYMTRSNINHANNENFYFPEDSRLAQNQNERQQIYFNQHYYEPLSSRLDEKKWEDDSLSANKVRFSYIPNPMKEESNMRLLQNEKENKESFGLSKEHMNRDDNAERIMNDNMHLSVEQYQKLHENRNSMLRSSNERQLLNHNYNSWPEYKMLPSTSQFEYRNGHLFNEHPNMRINEQQSRDPEPIENQNLHNSLSMLWNTENQHQDPSPKTFKSNLDFDHTLHKSNEYDNHQFIPHEVSKPGNNLEYRTRAQLFGDHVLDDTQSSRWYQTNQHNDHFANYYKTVPEVHEEHMNPHFRKHLHRVAVNHKLNDADTFSSYDFPSSSLHDHMQKYHQEKSSNIDSSMEPGMHMNMREPFAKSGTEFNNMHFNNPHGTPRFGAGLPIAGVNSGAMGVFPTANAGGCGIPLLLSCSPSVVSGSLARQHIVGPVLKSVDENVKYYMKRDAKNIVDVPDIPEIHNAPFHHHGTKATSEILNS